MIINNMISKLISYTVLFLGIFCVILFFDSVYATLHKKERRGFLGITILALLIAGIFILLDYFGFSPLPLQTTCW